ncbi:hypothetical protein LIER_35953 [Lithospermum erythrorhizon]|uniref:RING-type domain-containing protein n=1 Tax=Lithospermum erythrorhizon TaxID=34254 RepID=A0AAV3P075_LITER
MGNKLGRRQVVDEKYTRPQGLYHLKDVDHKKLRKLILGSKLAPCYPGDEENGLDLEECPICFLHYPSLNRSRCCTKGICTECFLQMKTPNSARPTQCPFCKTSSYAVEYRGVKTKEEKGEEQIEEQKVIEAKIRMRRQELLDEEEMMQKRREMSSESGVVGPSDSESSFRSAPSFVSSGEVTFQDSPGSAAIQQDLRPRQNRNGEFDLDLEDIMVMEAIWLSIQENDSNRNITHGDPAPLEHNSTDRSSTSTMAPHSGRSPSSGGLACAIASLTERQGMSGESSNNIGRNLHDASSSFEAPLDSRLMMARHQREQVAHGTNIAEAGTSYSGSEVVEEDRSRPIAQDEFGGDIRASSSSLVPESFEEQMMLAMAVSLAEAQVRTCAQGVSWH